MSQARSLILSSRFVFRRQLMRYSYCSRTERIFLVLLLHVNNMVQRGGDFVYVEICSESLNDVNFDNPGGSWLGNIVQCGTLQVVAHDTRYIRTLSLGIELHGRTILIAGFAHLLHLLLFWRLPRFFVDSRCVNFVCQTFAGEEP
jgi:hypothetical protein